MIELDNTMLLFIGSENYSGKKIPWAEMSVWVRFPSLAQNKQYNVFFQRFKVKQTKPDEVKSLHTKMSYGLRHTLIKIISGAVEPHHCLTLLNRSRSSVGRAQHF